MAERAAKRRRRDDGLLLINTREIIDDINEQWHEYILRAKSEKIYEQLILLPGNHNLSQLWVNEDDNEIDGSITIPASLPPDQVATVVGAVKELKKLLCCGPADEEGNVCKTIKPYIRKTFGNRPFFTFRLGRHDEAVLRLKHPINDGPVQLEAPRTLGQCLPPVTEGLVVFEFNDTKDGYTVSTPERRDLRPQTIVGDMLELIKESKTPDKTCYGRTTCDLVHRMLANVLSFCGITVAMYDFEEWGPWPSNVALNDEQADIIFVTSPLHTACVARVGAAWMQWGFYKIQPPESKGRSYETLCPPGVAAYGDPLQKHRGRCVTMTVYFALQAAYANLTKTPIRPIAVNVPDPAHLLSFLGYFEASRSGVTIRATAKPTQKKVHAYLSGDKVEGTEFELVGRYVYGVQDFISVLHTVGHREKDGPCIICDAFVDLAVE